MGNRIGDEIKGYQILERIGTGGFGVVFRAKHSTIGREVAIKKIQPRYANQPDFIRRFKNEAQIIARLEHLHIIPLYDYWRDPEGAYLVMRLMRGGSLREALSQGAYDLEETAQVIDQIASALIVAHRNNVIHRDIKPTNILLDEDKNAYLSDFGIALDLNVIGDISEEREKFYGSPDYLSPEQARMEEITPQTDIYSLGVIIYELLTGEHPYPNVNAVEKLFKHINEPIPMITSLDIDISRDVNEVIQKATAKNPQKRYEHVMALANAFKEAAGLSPSRAAKSLVALLTPREQEVLKGILEGKSNRKIAEDLTVEISTVKWYVNQVYRKLNVRSRVQAIVRARELNLIVDSDQPVKVSPTISDLPEPENPYKGLKAFQAADDHLFFGRESLIKKLISRLGEKNEFARFLAVVGPSGSGKSSLVKAGLVPALWRGEMAGSAKWFIVEMVPGSRPLDELEIALTRIAANQGGNIGEHLKRDTNGLLRVADLILPDDGSDLLIVIDQFEELFTLVSDEDKRKYFLNLLYAATTDKRSRVRIVITLRADYYDRPLQDSQFGELIRNRLETVLPLSADQLERAITLPARQVGVDYENGLVAKIIEDVLYQPGALPLLQYGLSELFEIRYARTLTHDGYQQIGGAVGALAKRAEELYAELGDPGKENVRQMFLRLVVAKDEGRDIRRRVARSELLGVSKTPDLMDDIIDTFSTYRLLSLDHDPATREPTVEVAHEAILREWNRLEKWMEEARDDLRLQRQITQLAQEWREANKDTSFLLHGSRLHHFEAWVVESEPALTPSEWEYIKESKDLQLRVEEEEFKRHQQELRLEKRSRRTLQMLVGIFILATILSSWLAVRAYQSEQDALVQASIGLAGQARLEIVEGLPERAVLLALEAIENYPYTWQAEQALFLAVQNHRLKQIVAGYHTGWIGWADWSPDGTQLVTASDDSTVRIWDSNNMEEILVLEGHADWVSSAKWSPDGRKLATSGRDGTAIVWDGKTGEHLLTFIHEDWIVEANWSPSGDRIATGSHDGTIKIWNSETGEEILAITGHADFVEVARWSPDGALLVSASGDNTARVWDSVTGEEVLVLDNHTDVVIDVSWSPNGTQVATSSFDGTAKIWDASTGNEVFTLVGEGRGEMRWVIWSPSGNRLLTIERGGNQIDGVAAIWDVKTGQQLFRLPGIGDLGFGVWSPDESRVAVNDDIGRTRIWNVSTGEEIFVLKRPQSLGGIVTWSPDGDRIITGYDDGTLLVWNAGGPELLSFSRQYPGGVAWSPDGQQFLRIEQGGPIFVTERQTGKTTHSFPPGEAQYTGASWSPDGRLIASGQDDGILRIWELDTGEELIAIKTSEVQIWDPAWSSDSKFISVTGYDGLVHVFEASTGDLLYSVSDQADGYKLHGLWSPDDSVIAAGNSGGLIQIWQAASGEMLESFNLDHWVMGFWWSPDGTQFLETDFLNSLAFLRDAATGEVVTTFAGHTAPVIFAHWSPNGNRVVTAGEDAVRIWDPITGFEYGFIDIGAWRVFWSPDNSHLLTTGTDGAVRVWRAFPDTESLILFAKDCCVLRELTEDERALFGLPVLDK